MEAGTGLSMVASGSNGAVARSGSPQIGSTDISGECVMSTRMFHQICFQVCHWEGLCSCGVVSGTIGSLAGATGAKPAREEAIDEKRAGCPPFIGTQQTECLAGLYRLTL